MPGEEGEVAGADPAEGGWAFQAKEGGVVLGKFWGAEQVAVVGEGDESGIEERVEMRGKQKAVEDIEPFVVGFAVRPRFGVARTEERGNG